MFEQELRAAAAAQGWKVNPQTGAVTGVCGGVAFRAAAENGMTLELSASIGEKQFPRLASQFGQTYPGAEVQPMDFGVRIRVPSVPETGEAFLSLIRAAVEATVSHIEVAHDDKFERYGEPFYVYLRGAAGAFLGALVGAVPWFLIGRGWISMWLGALISLASFYAYRLFKGAHHTTFATVTVILFFPGRDVWGGVFPDAARLCPHRSVCGCGTGVSGHDGQPDGRRPVGGSAQHAGRHGVRRDRLAGHSAVYHCVHP